MIPPTPTQENQDRLRRQLTVSNMQTDERLEEDLLTRRYREESFTGTSAAMINACRGKYFKQLGHGLCFMAV